MRILIGFFILIASLGCKKNSSDRNDTVTYYFDYSLQGKNVHTEYLLPPSNPAGIGMQSSVGNTIDATISSGQCNIAGTYCYNSTFRIAAQQNGILTPESFVIQLTQGQDIYNYISCSYCTYNSGAMKVTITKIERPQNINTKGKLEGSFSGTILSRKNNDTTTNAIVPITGKFLLPLD